MGKQPVRSVWVHNQIRPTFAIDLLEKVCFKVGGETDVINNISRY